MFSVFAKDFIHGTVVQHNMTVEEVLQLFLDWNDGKDIIVKNFIIRNVSIETISVKETDEDWKNVY